MSKQNVILTPVHSLRRAAEVLEESFKYAKYNKDTETLLNIAAGWVEIFERLKYIDTEDEDEEQPRGKIGFGAFPVNRKEENE